MLIEFYFEAQLESCMIAKIGDLFRHFLLYFLFRGFSETAFLSVHEIESDSLSEARDSHTRYRGWSSPRCRALKAYSRVRAMKKVREEGIRRRERERRESERAGCNK